MRESNGWIDVPFWFAWLNWSSLLAWPLLPVALILETVLHTGNQVTALSWLVASLLVGLTSTIASRFLHSRRVKRGN